MSVNGDFANYRNKERAKAPTSQHIGPDHTVRNARV